MTTTPMRHACGNVVHAEIFIREEVIAVFFAEHDREGRETPLTKCPHCDYPLDLDWCGHPWLIDPMTDQAIQNTYTSRLCSNCWGYEFEIQQVFDDKGKEVGRIVICGVCRENTIGFVTPQYARDQRSEHYINYRYTFDALSKAMGLEPETVPDQEQTLKELGF